MSDTKKDDEEDKVPPGLEAAALAAVVAIWRNRWKILSGIGGLLLTAACVGYYAVVKVAKAAVEKAAFSEYASALSKDAQFQTAVAGFSGSPVGCIVAWPSELAPPDGWLVCDGRTIDANPAERISVVLRWTYGVAPNGKVWLPDLRLTGPVSEPFVARLASGLITSPGEPATKHGRRMEWIIRVR